ncbi:glycosyltransferase family 4 protein [Paenibacillaceae bacterium WGS1546]|uniref:glycosyltransferase family 4 protein n=1 Tax=Cohnella sp. WGS1546 TaxID=3366810 RepID=UPI00372D860B
MAKILHLSEFTKGGVETHLNEVMKHQAERHDIYLMVSDHNSNRHSLQVRPDRLILYAYRRKPAYFLKAMREIRKKVDEIRPDIVHVHGTFAGVFLRALFFFKRKRPAVVYCSHGWAFLMDAKPWKRKLYAWAEKALSLRTDAIIHISKHEYAMAMHYGLSPRKSVVVYNGVSNASPVGDSPPIAVRPDKINLLFVGRFDRQKGLDVLLDAFNEQRFPDIDLYLVGDSVLKHSEYRYPDNAIRVGWVEHAEIDRYMSACDAVIVPSRWEGFGIVAIEALRNGKPVIASNRGALPEIVRHSVNGYVFDLERKEQLADILRNLNKRELAEMGRAGEKIFHEQFHSALMNQQIERLYETVLSRPQERYSVTAKKYV